MQNMQKSPSTLAREKETLAALECLVGVVYTEALKTTIATVSGFDLENVVGPGEAGVMTYQIYVNTDRAGIITDFTFSG